MAKAGGINQKEWSRAKTRSPLLFRLIKGFISVVVIVGVLFYGAGGWYFSNKLYTIALSGKARRSLKPNFDVPVSQVSANTVTLKITSNSPSEETHSGTWGLDYHGGYGDITTITSHTPTSITRSFHLISGTDPHIGQETNVTGYAFPQNPKVAFGINYQNVTYKGPLGNYPSWYIPGKNNTWAITVHGNGMTRLDGMTAVPVLHQLGLPVLMITYRNDRGAPRSKSDILRYGLTEWQDLAAAVTYALDHGATHVVLLGYSMGGGIVTNFLYKSQLADKVSATVLDAPMLNFSQTVDYGASQMNLPLIGVPLPQSLTDVAKWISAWRFGVKWNQLNFLASDKKLKTPILLFQGLNDKTVPPLTSTELAQARPHLVKYVTTNGAGHLESWNFHPNRYDQNLKSFLSKYVS